MALKITVPIGTDRGITSEAYVRIADYQISKAGSASFRIELFNSQADAITDVGAPKTTILPAAKNAEIGNMVTVSLLVPTQVMVTSTRSTVVDVPVERAVPDTKDEEGNILTTKMVTVLEPQVVVENVEEAVTTHVADLSVLANVDIFAYGYAQVKAKLVELFGSEAIVDC